MVDARRVRIPLEGKFIEAGAWAIQAKLKLFVQSSMPGFAPVNFIVDPGCGITSMPRVAAEDWGIPIPSNDNIKLINVRTSTGSSKQRVRLCASLLQNHVCVAIVDLVTTRNSNLYSVRPTRRWPTDHSHFTPSPVAGPGKAMPGCCRRGRIPWPLAGRCRHCLFGLPRTSRCPSS